MVKEVIRFRLPLGPRTDEFTGLYREVTGAMKALGVEPGVAWMPVTDIREVIVEREFESLAQYEADDKAFHGGPEFMALWRRMEACADSMYVELWQNGVTGSELIAQRTQSTKSRRPRSQKKA